MIQMRESHPLLCPVLMAMLRHRQSSLLLVCPMEVPSLQSTVSWLSTCPCLSYILLQALSHAACVLGAGVNASLGDPDTPLGKVVRILNNQLQALTHVDERTASLQASLDAAPSAANLWALPQAVCGNRH